MNFGKIPKEGGGAFPIQKSILRILDLYNGHSSDVFRKNCNIIFRKWGGGGRRPFGSVTRPLWPQRPSSPPQQGCSAPSPAAEGDGRWGRGGQGGQGQGRDSFCWWWWPSSWAQWPWWAWWLCWPWWQRDQGQGGLMLYRITRFKIMDCLMKDFFSMSNPLCS